MIPDARVPFRRLAIMGTLLGVMAAGCSTQGTPRLGPGARESAIPNPSPIAPTRSPDVAATPATTRTTRDSPAPVFHATVSPIDQETRARMTSSWKPGCPVRMNDLRLITLDHWGFDRIVHEGELVVHAQHAEALVQVFRTLFEHGFPIQRMELVDVYGADDDRSMAANNTSAFNCRPVTGNPDVWSEHSYGWAIDINPIQNPYVTAGGTVLPPEGRAHVDRSQDVPGQIDDGGVVVEAFAAIGWEWGGHWSFSKDYQHFSVSDR
jgi:D-alanyl-D-alanine carboxypeptidase